MLITIEKVLTVEQVNEARQKLASAEWVDGRVTAGYQAQDVKRNAQIPENSPVAKELGEMILAGLARSPRFMSGAKPLVRMLTRLSASLRRLANASARTSAPLSFLRHPANTTAGN